MRAERITGEFATQDTGPVGPVAVSALLFLLAVSPLMRGGNRNVALIVLEGAALAFLVALLANAQRPAVRVSVRTLAIAFLVSSPLWLSIVYLLPVPMGVWEATPGRSIYPELLSAAGLSGIHALPLSLVPDATAASLLAGIPIAAAFLAGVLLRLPQLKMVLAALVALAFLQVAMGLLQVAGGSASSFYFGGQGGRPFGTFANPNHFANYLAMALAAYIWLAWTFLGNRRRAWDRTEASHARAVALWSAGALLLVTGILMSRSRGAALAGLPAAMCAFAIAVTEGRRARSWRGGLFMAGAAVVAAVALVGFDFVASRFTEESVSDAASVRSLLAASSFEAAAEFWPWGAGWGTYAGVYPRFQPASIVGVAIYAHQDYAQLLFEGGIFAVLLALAFTGLVASRAVQLVRSARKHGRLRRDEMASALCGVGLLGFLLHSIVEFNMHIPANAIVAALLAGAYLRPLERPESEQASQ